MKGSRLWIKVLSCFSSFIKDVIPSIVAIIWKIINVVIEEKILITTPAPAMPNMLTMKSYIAGYVITTTPPIQLVIKGRMIKHTEAIRRIL